MLLANRSLVASRPPTVPTWRRRLEQSVLQHPLLQSRPSLEGVRALGGRPPRALMIGVGLCNESRLSAGLPVDVLGLVLPAESLRRAIGAQSIVVLVADVHARLNRLPAADVERRAKEAVLVLERVRRGLDMPHLEVLRARELDGEADYRALLAEVERRAPRAEHGYVTRQVADVEHLHRTLGGILKVGWSLTGSSGAPRGHDERFFDARHRALFGPRVGFVYCKPGRTLDDERKKAPPYVTLDARRRVCLRPDEDVRKKLAAATRSSSKATVNGVRNHLRAVTRAACALSEETVRGPVDARVQALISRVFGD